MSSPTTNPELRDALVELGIHGLAEQFDDFLARATKTRMTPMEQVEELVRIERRERSRRGLERRMTRARIGSFKPMTDFDWNWPRSLDRPLIERVLALGFVNDGANALLLGPHGVGKTMMLKNVAYKAVQSGFSVLFVTAAKMLNDLSAQDSARSLERRIKHYCSSAILCVDELGYLSYDNRAADLLFEVVSRRHEAQRPIAMSSNLAFTDWPTVFPSATCTVALVDRLTHRADIAQIDGPSWRCKESKERNAQRKKTTE